jgi:hypothetical protein
MRQLCRLLINPLRDSPFRGKCFGLDPFVTEPPKLNVLQEACPILLEAGPRLALDGATYGSS